MSWCFDEAPEGVHRFHIADKLDHRRTFVVRKAGTRTALARGTASIGTPLNAPGDYLHARGYRDTVTVWCQHSEGTAPSTTVGRNQ